MMHPHDSIIVQTLGRFLIPVVQIFGLYVLYQQKIFVQIAIYKYEVHGNMELFG